MAGIYDNDGKTRLTASPGTGFCGLYAPDGSYYYTLAPGSGFCGSIAPDGSWYVTDATGSAFSSVYAPDGSIRVTSANEYNGAWRVSGISSVVASWNASTSTLAMLTAIVNHTRTSLATMFDSTGKLTYAPNNWLLYSNTFTNAAWSKFNLTITNVNAVADPFGGTNATTLAAAGATSIIQQFTARDAATGLNTLWMRRRTGTGQISLIKPDGSNNYVTLTGTWQKVTSTSAQGATYFYFGVQIDTAGDAIDVYYGTSSKVTYETTPRTGDQVITTSAAYYGPRIDYDPNTLAVKGLLIEEARTKSLVQSNTLSNASWSRNLVDAPAQNVTGIDGTTSAWTITASGTADTFLYQTGSFVGPYVYSAVFKAGTNNWAYIAANGGGNKRAYVFFDLTNGVVGSTTFRPDGAYAGTLTGSGIIPLGNGFYRCWMAVTGTTDTYVAFGLSDANTSVSTTNGRTFIASDLEAEAGAFPTSITRTAASSVTRAADAVQFTGAAVTALQGSAGSAVVEHTSELTTQPGTLRLIGTTSSRALIYGLSDTSAASWNGSVSLNATIGSSGKFSTTARTAAAWSAAGRSIVANGGTVATDANAAFGGVSPAGAWLGSDGGTANWASGWYKSFALYNQRLPDATLQAKSVVGASY